MPTALLRRLAYEVRMMRLSSDDDERIGVVEELCEVATRCADIEERRGVDELDDRRTSVLLVETFQELEKRHGGAKRIPEVERLLHLSQNAKAEFVAGIYATLGALEVAKEEDEVDARLRRERAAGDRDSRNG